MGKEQNSNILSPKHSPSYMAVKCGCRLTSCFQYFFKLAHQFVTISIFAYRLSAAICNGRYSLAYAEGGYFGMSRLKFALEIPISNVNF